MQRRLTLRPLPINCADKMREINARGSKLYDMFFNGNKSYVHAELLSMKPREALGVFASIAEYAHDDPGGALKSLLSYVKEAT